ncbi:hypothetical protein PAMC26510_15120 [Caballeronia sordidicola]|uniref:Integrase n=1 Tax=Caballeronia sordidicola TaxID=196367 RepID=A0A242N7X5_CABSO|nr:hypothetical protein PAMC26510_15120 [Caballeronia sordidicola]OTP79789.1 hypothetical protein PAMC26577_00070 [Caballeronia sordidicola]
MRRMTIKAVQAWLALHETSPTQRAYRREAERLILWQLSSATGPCRS